MTHDRSPIVALATPAGRGALAVVRLSGEGAFDVAARVTTPWPFVARRATVCTLRDATGAPIDRALAVAMPGPASFTGDDTVEFSVHGGSAVSAAVLAACIAAGAREARPGEYTRRAVLGGKLDLAQAEAIGDLVEATTQAMRRAALAQLDGGLSRRVAMLRDALVSLDALLAYDIDFPEEDDGPIAPARIADAADRVLAALNQLLATAPAGEAVRHGATVVIAGAPNAGKSSLFNALLGSARALVTPVAGTTRDAIDAVLDTPRWPVRLVDTAGLRETADVVERLGIEVSERALAGASLVLACGESDHALADAVQRVRALTEAPVLAVRTKGDVAEVGSRADPSRTDDLRAETRVDGIVRVSAERGDGLPALVTAMLEALDARHGVQVDDAPRLTRERHVRAVREARDEVARFVSLWGDGATPAVISATHVRGAIEALDGLIGTVSVDDVLDRVFATFCIGK
ncbi:MAG: tRNA uridine-5-carboxymethylaminomethyl(34) synthesis GTPase MnmE [Gemmatimonadaceae bacterium]|jgi:tRNA modification GTPase|nr:tRNA uridine-5-carboxymethylaminomethyl(34) synthesis GTPase MnmE [Gemmatimonadaceae bacterium]